MTDKITTEREALLPCPFCGDDGDKGRQEVTQMIEGRNKFTRIICRACGAMCPEENWNQRAALAAQPAEPVALDNACMTEQAIDEYLSDYTMEGDSGSHTPDESELLVIKDAIMGLLVYPDFLASFAPPAPAAVPPADGAELAQWRKLRDPELLHANLIRGLPAQLSREQFLHLAGGAVPLNFDVEACIRAGWKRHKYAQGTGPCVAFYRGAKWLAEIAAAGDKP